jgi:hypothetical protein
LFSGIALVAAGNHIPEGIIASGGLRNHMVQDASFPGDAPKTVKALAVFPLDQCINVSSVFIKINLIYIDRHDLRELGHQSVNLFRQEDTHEVTSSGALLNLDASLSMQYANPLSNGGFRKPARL